MAFPVAVIQLELEPGGADENRRQAAALARDAISRGARLVLLPEACVSDIYRGAGSLAESIPGPSTDTFSKIAGEAVIALPILERAQDDRVYSACALIGRNGLRGIAHKTHLFHDASGMDMFRDAELISAGGELDIFSLSEVRVGVLLGFDAEFPEAFRALALRGADLILVAQNCVEPDLNFLRAMALRNRVPLLVANRLGFKRIYPTEPEMSALTIPVVQDERGASMVRCKGSSAIIGADGKFAAQAGAVAESRSETAPDAPERVKIPRGHIQDEEILTASFRIDELRVQRLISPFISARREDLYRGE